MEERYKKGLQEFDKKINTIINDGDITKSRERQATAEKLIRQKAIYKKRNGKWI